MWILGLSFIVLIMGLAVFDVWGMYSTQRQLTALADSASAAAAQGVDLNRSNLDNGTIVLDQSDAEARAKDRLSTDLGRNPVACGATPSAGETAACIDLDPTSQKVTVTLTREVRFTLFAIGGMSKRTVSASSTATSQLR